MKLLLIPITASLILSGCVAPALRGENEDKFKTRTTAMIAREKVPLFMDCVLDGFTREQRYANIFVWQYKRSNGYRIEVKTDKYPLLSADILDDGNAKLVESIAAGLIPTGAEITAFDACVEKFGKKTGS